MGDLLNNGFFLSIVAWPGVILACALINMLFHWSFSWSELILDFLAGVVIGVCFYFGTAKDANAASHFFLVFSSGLFGLLHALGVKALEARDVLFGVSAAAIAGSVLLTSALDLATRKVGLRMSVGGGLLSIPTALLKLPFSFCTTAVGLLIFLAGLFTSFVRRETRVGFLGGVPYVEWNSDVADSYWATTIGATFMVWKGTVDNVLKHELYHTRQYVYLHDWLIPFWLLGGLWGLASARISEGSASFSDFSGARGDKEVGNPLERAAYAADAT